MWSGLLWIVLIAAAGFCYPRRPRTSAALFLAVGVLSVFLMFTHNRGNNLAVAAGPGWIALGLWYLVKFRTSEARAKHVAYWTEKA